MSNAYSTIRTYRPPTTSLNRNLLNTVMAVKQNRFDSNVNTVNEAIQTFGNIDLIRDQDREYLLNNLEGVIQTLDNTNDIDFSQSGIGSELVTHLSKSIDEEVLSQAENTSNIRNYQSTVAQLKKKSPKDYATQNDWFATTQAGLSNYLQGGSDNLGKLEYTPFVDYNKEIDDNIFKWAKEFGIKTFYEKSTTEDGISFMLEGEELTKNQVKSFLRTKLDSRHKNQILIDTSYNFQNDSDKDISDKYKTYHKDYQDASTLRKIALKNKLTKQGYSEAEIAQRLDPLDEEIAFHKTRSEVSQIGRNEALQFLSMESFLDSKSSAYAKKEYTKVSPDGSDIRRAELQLKRIKASSSSKKGFVGASGSTVPGTLVPILNPTEEGKGGRKDSLITTALGKYESVRGRYVSKLIGNDPEFAKQYQSLTSDQARSEAIQLKMDEFSTVNIGGDVDPELSKLQNEYRVELKNLHKVNDTYRNSIESGLDTLYNSMVDEIATEGQDFNYQNFAKEHPKTVELLTTKGKNLTEKERDVIRYELAQDTKNLRGISDDAKHATEDYVATLYENIKDIESIKDPNEKSNIRKMMSNVGQRFLNAAKIIGSGFDEDVAREVENNPNLSEFSDRGILEELGQVALNTSPLHHLLKNVGADQDIDDLQEEDLQLNVGGKPTRAVDFLKGVYESAEASINRDLKPTEERLNQGFEIVFSSTTEKDKSQERKELEDFMAAKAGFDIKNSERISISLNNQDGTALVKEVDSKEGIKQRQFMQNELPPSLLNKFETKQAEWQFDVRNPNAPEPILNYTTFKDKEKASKHFENLRDKYRAIQENPSLSIEDNRKLYAPTQLEISKSLKQAFPNKDASLIAQLVSTPYQIKMTPDQSRGVYTYEVVNALTKKSTGFKQQTRMSVYNEGMAAANSTRYLIEYLKSVLSE